jgi:hypothetical protein
MIFPNEPLGGSTIDEADHLIRPAYEKMPFVSACARMNKPTINQAPDCVALP